MLDDISLALSLSSPGPTSAATDAANLVLKEMVDQGDISQSEYNDGLPTPSRPHLRSITHGRIALAIRHLMAPVSRWSTYMARACVRRGETGQQRP